MSEDLKERLAAIFPYALGALLPLPGLFLAGFWLFEKKTYEAGVLLAAVALGTLVWVLLLTGG